MDPFDWQPAWNLGIERLDREHRMLIAELKTLSRRFAAAGEERVSATDPDPGAYPPAEHEALMTALEAFGDQVLAHFDREEDFMRSIRYPDLGAHRSEHALLHAEYVEMVRSLRHQAITRLDAETISALRRWLVSHILAADKEYADYYAQCSDISKEYSVR